MMLWWLACSSPELKHIPGTTTRIAEPVGEPGTELELKIFTTLAECRATTRDAESARLCLPHVDRSRGEVRLGFQLRLDAEDYPVPLTKDNIVLTHQGTRISEENGQRYTIIPHDAIRSPQLFILLIDGSSSMRETDGTATTRMTKVRKALTQQSVVDAFFPEGVNTGVVVLQFTDEQPVPLGDSLEVIEDGEQYRSLVAKDLKVRQGYTHLYDAVMYATGPLLDEKAIKRHIDLYQAQPTVVVLTDGFNNHVAGDVCADNANRLQPLIKHLVRTRRADEVDLRKRPTVFTVGLGKPYRPRFVLPETEQDRVLPEQLCGKSYLDWRIDGVLETRGIDNASLDWIATLGGGYSYVRRNQAGLAEAFQGAAAERYYWFEARYQTDPFHLRRKFKSGIRLTGFAEAQATVEIHPSAWLDGPPGHVGPDGWSEEQPLRHTATVALPLAALLILASYLVAAWFNTKRALFGRIQGSPAPHAPPSSEEP